MHGNSAENFLLHRRRKKNQKKPPDMLRIQIRRALISHTCYQYGTHWKNCTVFAKLEGISLGGSGLRCNLESQEVIQSAFPIPTQTKLNSSWRFSAAEMRHWKKLTRLKNMN